MKTTLTFFGFATVLFALTVSGCGNRKVAATSQSTAPKPQPSGNIPLRLNLNEMGTTSDLSTLQKSLRQVFERRVKEGAYRAENSGRIETTVYLEPEGSMKVADIAPVS